jgi:beta-lactamase regulating signal transducer with metallopeptidase domain
MNLPLLNHALETAFAWTWKTSLQATVLIALVLLIQLAFAKILAPRWRYFLGLLILLRLVLPTAPASPLSIFNLGNHREPPIQVDNRPATFHPFVNPIVVAATAVPPAAHMIKPAPPQASAISVRAVASWLWLAGFAVMVAMVARQQCIFVRKLRRWERVREPRVLELLERCRTMLGVRRNVIVLAATGLNTPALFGIVRPRLLLPVEMLERLDDRELRHVLLHELIHLKRGDLFVNWAMILVRAAHWFNPAVWLAFRRLRAEQELACDAVVMASLAADERRHYGRTLLKLLDDFSPGALCPGLVPFITSKQIIKRRITMISNFKPAGRITAGASLALLLALGPLTFTRAADQTNATVPPSAAPLVVTIGKDGTFRVGAGQPPVDLEQLTKTLQEEFAKDPQRTLRIRADDTTSINDLEDVINVAKKLKITSITFRDEGSSGVAGQKALAESEAARAEAKQAQADVRMELAKTREELANLRAQTIESHNSDFSRTDSQDKIPASAREKYQEDSLALARATAMYNNDLMRYPPGSDLLKEAKNQVDELEAAKKKMVEEYPQLADDSVQMQFDAAVNASSSKQQMKDLEENIRLTSAKLNDLRNLKETYANDLAEHSSDQRQVVTHLSDAIADAESQRAKQAALLSQLRSMSRDDLRQALPTTVPDAILNTLIQDELEAEARLVEQTSKMGGNNPDVQTTRRLIEKVNSQIDQRVKGIMNGLRAQVDAANASIESLQNEVNAASKRQAELSDLALQITKLENDLRELQSERSLTGDTKQLQMK